MVTGSANQAFSGMKISRGTGSTVTAAKATMTQGIATSAVKVVLLVEAMIDLRETVLGNRGSMVGERLQRFDAAEVFVGPRNRLIGS